MPKKRGCLGFKGPVLIGIVAVILVLGVVGFLAGALGDALFADLDMPEWLVVEQPHPELPPEEIFAIGGISVSNTMLSSWISILILGLLFYFGTRNMKMIPGRFQSAIEGIISYLLDFCTDIAGEKNGRRFFPIVATIFLYVIANAWLSLVPGVGSILITNGHNEVVHLFRGVNTDINFPLALALISFIMVEFWGIKSVGFGHYMTKFFNFAPLINAFKTIFKGKIKEGASALFDGVIRVFIGFIELLSEFVRILSFTFRLFGNMTGGEILLLMMVFLMPFLLVIPFYGLELLVGFIQALIFAGLTLVFATIAVTPHAEEGH